MHEVNFFEYIVNKNRINLSEQAIYLSKKMDGKTADEELKEEFKNRFQLTLSNKNFRNFLNRLSVENLLIGKNNGYLISKLSPLYCKKL